MRSFLIRDILSGPASGAGGATSGDSGPTSKQQQQQQQHHQQHLQASSSFVDCAAAQSLAATQARFLAKLAEHQQQVQASKYYEQLQQQHQQLLNLNLSHHHLQLQQHLQQQQQVGLSRPLAAAMAANGAGPTGSLEVASSGGGGAGIASSMKKEKTSSFAYDCTSPISSISDVERPDEDEDDEDDDDDDDHHHQQQQRGHDDESSRGERGAGEDDDDEQIEVEKLTVDEAAGSSEMGGVRKGHRGASGERAAGESMPTDGSTRMSLQQQQQHNQQPLLEAKQLTAPFQLNSPLDALFQMTSSTFDALKRGEKRKDRDPDHHGSTNFTSKQTSKKKRKSRTAFTNNQIYELERRFRMQKYLSPTDRDEIANTLNLSNAQVITWFQNRRAKLKRDLEEQKRDIETAALLNFPKTFLESFQAAIKATDAICRTRGTDIHGEI